MQKRAANARHAISCAKNIKILDSFVAQCDSRQTPSGRISSDIFKMPRPGGTMSSSERRIAPRKIFSIPIRIRPLIAESLSVAAGSTISRNVTSNNVAADGSVAVTQMSTAPAGSRPARVLDMQEGETVNLSERGIYFKTAQKVKIGQAMELYFTLPRELTGRSPEPVRCSARVVRVEQYSDERGWTGVGASVEQFEPLQRFRTWDN
jgi:hypothetical protein